jgi:hypothetical protein
VVAERLGAPSGGIAFPRHKTPARQQAPCAFKEIEPLPPPSARQAAEPATIGLVVLLLCCLTFALGSCGCARQLCVWLASEASP